VVTIDNTSPDDPSSISGASNDYEHLTLTYINATTTDASSVVVLRKAGSVVTDSPVEGATYVAGNTIGGSTVVCVASGITLGGRSTCSYTSPLRATDYYFKLFTKDTTGNYSSGIVPTGQPFKIVPKNGGGSGGGTEIDNGGAILRSGGGQGNGGNGSDTGSSTNATTTSTTSPSQGGGGGDVGFHYEGSNLVVTPTFYESMTRILKGWFTGGASDVYADEGKVASCFISLFGVCIVR
jgi:hypothetical protein